MTRCRFDGAGSALGVLLLLLPCTALAASQVDPQLFSGMKWRQVGPFRGGRVVAVSGVPGDPATWYFGAVAGGVWKSTNAGSTWQPVFDEQKIASIGAIAVADSDHNIIYVGTGEACPRGNITYGDGVYKSLDAGKTWQHLGLRDSRHIGAIVIDPRNPDVVFVAALGHAFGPNDERGIFRTGDGGKTWQRVLFRDRDGGGIDVDPAAVAVAEQHPLPGLAAIPGAEDPALIVGPERVAERGDEHDIRVSRVDDDGADVPAVPQTQVLPGLAGIERLVYAVAIGDVAARAGLAGADIDDVVIRVGDRDRSDRGDLLLVEDRLPGAPGVGALPDPTGHRTEIPGCRIPRHAAHRHHSAAAERPDLPPFHAAEALRTE